jgi:hypothetical protein
VTGQEAAVAKLREVWFWAEVFGDHATFIHDRLAPDETEMIARVRGFHQTFTQIHEEAKKAAESAGISGPAGSYALIYMPRESPLAKFQGQELDRYDQIANTLTKQMLEKINHFKHFKEMLIYHKLDCHVKLSLGPVLLQHMVNEADEALQVLSGVLEQAIPDPALMALHHHLLWLPDAAEHAAILHSGLDSVEQQLRLDTHGFEQLFNGMHLKALELYSMLRVAPRMVGALRRLNADALQQIGTFRTFLVELREHAEDCEIMGTLTPLFADHMLREELYYTEQMLTLKEGKL